MKTITITLPEAAWNGACNKLPHLRRVAITRTALWATTSETFGVMVCRSCPAIPSQLELTQPTCPHCGSTGEKP